MTFDINTFKATGLKYGGARPSLFIVEFAPPGGFVASSSGAGNPTVTAGVSVGGLTVPSGTATGVIGINGNSLSRLTCRSATLPPAIVADVQVPYFGRRIKVAGERTFPPWEVNIINDENFVMRALLESWSNGINRLEANIRDPLFDVEGYKADLNVRQYSKTGVEIRAYKMIGAWPSQVSAIELNWELGDAIEYFSCTWQYDYWLPETELTTDGAVQYATAATDLNNAPSG